MYVSAKSVGFNGYGGSLVNLCFKDGTSFCYCAYVLRILGYLGFLRNLPTNTKHIFVRFMTVEKADLSKGYQIKRKNQG